MVCAVSASSVAKWPDSGATISTRGKVWPPSPASATSWRSKRSSVPKALRWITRSVIGTSRASAPSPTVTERMPKPG